MMKRTTASLSAANRADKTETAIYTIHAHRGLNSMTMTINVTPAIAGNA